MAHAITLLLDPASDAEVRALWKLLDDAGVPSLASHGHGRHSPHVTLVVFDDGDPRAVGTAAAAALAGRHPLRLRYGGHGVFHATRVVVHLPVATSGALRETHTAVTEVLRRAGARCWPHYGPDQWIPHVTLAMDVPPALAGAASSILAARALPAEGLAVRLALVEVETGTTREIARFA